MSSNGVQGSPHRGFKRTRETPHPKAHGRKPAVPVGPDNLTPDEERYALALFGAEGNKSQSDVYLEVFPEQRRLGQNTIWTKSSLLATKVELRVKQLRDAVALPLIADAIVTERRIREELARLAFTDLADFVEWGPDGVIVRDGASLTPDQRAAVSEVTQTITKDGGTIRFRLHDKQKALEALADRLWPVPKEPVQNKAITVRVLYEDAQGGKSGVQVQVE